MFFFWSLRLASTHFLAQVRRDDATCTASGALFGPTKNNADFLLQRT